MSEKDNNQEGQTQEVEETVESLKEKLEAAEAASAEKDLEIESLKQENESLQDKAPLSEKPVKGTFKSGGKKFKFKDGVLNSRIRKTGEVISSEELMEKAKLKKGDDGYDEKYQETLDFMVKAEYEGITKA